MMALWSLPHSTVNQGVTVAQVLTIGAQAFPHLVGKLASGSEHQSTRRTRTQFARIFEELIQDRQREGGGLPSTRLGTAEKISPFQQRRYGLRLDRSQSLIIALT